MLQGPCISSQKSLIELNVIASLNRILRWKLNSEDYLEHITSSLTVSQRSKLVKLKISKELDDTHELDFATIERNLKGKFRMDNNSISTVKYKSVVTILALLENQTDKSVIARLKKDIQYVALKKLIVEVYIEFLVRYNGKYLTNTMNHVDLR